MIKQEKVVIITGAVRGLGKALALDFGSEGYFVVGLYKADAEAARSLEAELRDQGANGLCIQADISRETDVSAAFRIPEIQQASHLTLINNACASFRPTPFHLLAWEDFESQIAVTLKGAFLCSKEAVRVMAPKKTGMIISVLSSVTEGIPPKGYAAYGSAKSALLMLSKSLVSEYHRLGIRSFSVSPGFMDTRLTQNWDPQLRAVDVHSPSDVSKRILKLALDPKGPENGENLCL